MKLNFARVFIFIIIGDPTLSMLCYGVFLIFQYFGSCTASFFTFSRNILNTLCLLLCKVSTIIATTTTQTKLSTILDMRRRGSDWASFILPKHCFTSWCHQQNVYSNQSFLSLNEVQYKTLSQDLYMYIKLYNFGFIPIKLRIQLRYLWLSIIFWGM